MQFILPSWQDTQDSTANHKQSKHTQREMERGTERDMESKRDREQEKYCTYSKCKISLSLTEKLNLWNALYDLMPLN